MRRAARIDANHNEIVNALRQIGAKVQSLAQLGKGVPDLLVAHRGRWFVAEVKDGAKPPSARKLSPDEQVWHDIFNRSAKVSVWNSVEQAIEELTCKGENDV